MAKSARASQIKANNQRLKAKVFGPVEAERAARLSAKLMEIAAAPKPPKAEMEVEKEGRDMPRWALQASELQVVRSADTRLQRLQMPPRKWWQPTRLVSEPGLKGL